MFPVAVFWRSVCAMKQPVLLVKGDGLQIIAATEEAHELLGSRNTSEISALLQGGLDTHTLSRIQIAVTNPVALVTELPIMIQSPGVYVNVNLTVSTLPEYPEPNAALLLLKDARSSSMPEWARTARELLSRIPLPAWVVDATGSVVFSNAAYPEFPLELIRGESLAAENSDGDVAENMARLLADVQRVPLKVRSTSTMSEEKYNLGAHGQWRVLHFPLKNRAGGRFVGVVAIPQDKPQSRRCVRMLDALDAQSLPDPDALTQVLQVKEAERTALAREIHDSLGQELTVLKLELRRLYNMVVGTAAASTLIVEHFNSVRHLVDNLAKSARRIAYEMRQDMVTGGGLSQSAQQLVVDLRERLGLQIQLEIMPGWVDPEQGMAHHMHRSLQEMLNNVSKHAKANRCLVRMGLTGNAFWLEVRDDGIGMPAQMTKRSIGLRSLTERAEIYGGRVSIQTRPEVDGTLVRMELLERRLQPAGRQSQPALGHVQ